MSGINITISIGEDGKVKVDTNNVSIKENKREFKGQSANRHVDDYCVLDLETTGLFVCSSEIIEISALKVRNNEIVAEFSTLVNPQCHIPAEATAVNHITDEMVKNMPVLDEVLDDFLTFVGNDVIIGYNNAGYDMNLLYDCVFRLRNRPFSNDYLDMLHAVRRSLPDLENAKLETVCKHYGFDIDGEHRALKDCHLTKDCYDRLFADFGDTAFIKRSSSSRKGVRYSYETISLQELHKLLVGILSDDELTTDEVDSLRCWLEEHRDLSGNYPFDKAFNALDKVLEDGVITENELQNLKIILEGIIDPVKSQCSHEQIESLDGVHICITGDFNYGPRKEVEQLIVSAGGIIDNTVKKVTNYVVVGAHGSDAWKIGNYGTKIQKAMELNEKGLNIKVMEEAEFIPAISSLLENCDVNESTIDYECFNIFESKLLVFLKELCIEHRLFTNSLQYGKDDNSDGQGFKKIRIFEEEYPAPIETPHEMRKGVFSPAIVLIKEVANTKSKFNGLLMVRIKDELQSVVELPKDAEGTKTENGYFTFYISPKPEQLLPYFRTLIEYRLKRYKSNSSFGCCSSYNECSDAKQCVHYNLLYSTGCIYRLQHLDKGDILYGKDKCSN